MLNDPISTFGQAAADAGLPIPGYPIADGELHRYKTEGDKQENSWYVLHADGAIPAGAFGCWKRGQNEKWCSKRTSDLSESERRRFQQQIEQAKAKREKDQAQTTAAAKHRACEIWEEASKAESHPYLSRKQVEPHGVYRRGNSLVVPARDNEGVLHTLQFISEDGDKRFMPGGRVSGCYHAIGKPNGRLLVAEGYATAASLYEATGCATAVAFNTTNLKAVAKALREKFPNMQIILCADNDTQTDGNPGVRKATEAAQEIEGLLAIPNCEGDFNDLATDQGAEAVRAIIEAAKEPLRTNGQDNDDERFTQDGEGESHPLPTPLPNSLPSVKTFEPDLLPSVLSVSALEVSKQTQAPIDFIAAGYLVALSSLVARHIGIRPTERDTWEVIPNLWGLGVGRPSAKKSPAFKAVLSPLDKLEDVASDAYEEALEYHQQAQIVHEQQVKANKGEIYKKLKERGADNGPGISNLAEGISESKDEPACKRFVANDPTVEKLGEIQRAAATIIDKLEEYQPC